MANSFPRQPVYFFSRTCFPSPEAGSQTRVHDRLLERSIRDIPRQLSRRPDAILFLSGDWVEPVFTISPLPESATVPDEFGVRAHPDEAEHRVSSMLLSRRVVDLLDGAALPTREALDHRIDDGMLILLNMMYPNARIPVARLSLRATLDPGIHWAAGHAIAQLRDENVLIIGCGSSRGEEGWTMQEPARLSVNFDMWLRQALFEEDPSHRIMALMNWERAPAARIAHPLGNSLMPLLFIAGTAGEDAAKSVVGGRHRTSVSPSNFRFG
ncbi:hypothetical protein B7G54_07040 [Burkholderia puraquae]|nr:class III extradiol ring-cleavage dioxygenase [Burkholderia puraquae]ORT87292.1 hypothetical protein B7G54_07040 [Burkholderia puraquae]